MPKSYCKIFVHLVWSTYDRLPLIEENFEAVLHAEIAQQAQRLGCPVLAIGGVQNHIHLLFQLPPTLSISHIAKEIKGATSFFVNQQLSPQQHFRWQGSYSAHSVSRWDISKVAEYIARQKEHHAQGTTRPQLESDDASR